MPKYELTFIARQDITEQDAKNLAEKFTKVIKDGKGNVTKTEFWGLRNLAYLINKNRKGHYIHLCLEASPEILSEVERQLRLNEDVLRHMSIVVEEFEKGPSLFLKQQDEKDAA